MQSFVGVDVPHSTQQLLIEQRALDGRLAAAKESSEIMGGNFERLAPDRPGIVIADLPHRQAAKPARIYKAQLAS